MTLPREPYVADRGVRAMNEISEAASLNGTSDMSLEEINAEIEGSRAERGVGEK